LSFFKSKKHFSLLFFISFRRKSQKPFGKVCLNEMMEKLSLLHRFSKKLFPLSLGILICFFGCTSRKSLPDFRDSAFCAEIVYVTKSTRICATVQAEAPREASDPLPRDVTIYFSSPEALRGLTLTRSSGEISFAYQGLITTSEHTDLLRPVVLLLGEDHTDTEDPNYAIRLTQNTGLPEEIITSEEQLQISDFKKINKAE
jgi:hypothetical protein